MYQNFVQGILEHVCKSNNYKVVGTVMSKFEMMEIKNWNDEKVVPQDANLFEYYKGVDKRKDTLKEQ